MKKYDLILFDADGTLFDYDAGEYYALKKTLGYFSFIGNFENLRTQYRIINHAMWKELEGGTIKKEVIKTQRFAKLFLELGLEYDVSLFSRLYLEYLGEASFLIDGAEEICRALSEDFFLAIITNGMKEVQHSRFNRSSINRYFDDIITSEEAGIEKPDPRFFEYTCDRLNYHDRSRILVIGDSLSADIQGGLSSGIHTCWLNLSGAANNTSIVPEYSVSSLDEIHTVLYPGRCRG